MQAPEQRASQTQELSPSSALLQFLDRGPVYPDYKSTMDKMSSEAHAQLVRLYNYPQELVHALLAGETVHRPYLDSLAFPDPERGVTLHRYISHRVGIPIKGRAGYIRTSDGNKVCTVGMASSYYKSPSRGSLLPLRGCTVCELENDGPHVVGVFEGSWKGKYDTGYEMRDSYMQVQCEVWPGRYRHTSYIRPILALGSDGEPNTLSLSIAQIVVDGRVTADGSTIPHTLTLSAAQKVGKNFGFLSRPGNNWLIGQVGLTPYTINDPDLEVVHTYDVSKKSWGREPQVMEYDPRRADAVRSEMEGFTQGYDGLSICFRRNFHPYRFSKFTGPQPSIQHLMDCLDRKEYE